MAVTRGEIQHAGLTRTYRLYRPGTVTQPAALVVLLHGGGGDGARIAQITHFDEIAEREGFCVIYPDGIGNAWNDGRADGGGAGNSPDIDDVGFLKILIASIMEECGAEPSRVYMAGASNGAMMTHRMACERSELIAGIGLVMGTIPEDVKDTLVPSRPVPAIIISGTEDPIVPWNGGPVRVGTRTYGRVVSVEETVAFWVRHNGAAMEAEREWLAKADGNDATRVWREYHHGGNGGADVVLYGIEGGGHTWPGGEQYLAEWIIGRTNRDFDASETIWDFFKKLW